MSNIGQRVFVLGGNQLYMTLANEEYVRTLSIGSNWTKIRIGMFHAFTPDGTNNLTGVTLTLGICSGTVNPFGAASTTNWVGACLNGSVLGGLTYNANSGNPYFSGSGNVSFGKRVGNTNTLTAPGGAFTGSTNTGAIQRRTPIYVDITKGNPNYTVSSFNCPPANFAQEFTFANFMDAMEQTSASVGGVSFNASNSQTVATSEVAGTLDTLDILWNKSLFPIEIYAIAVYRMQ